MERKRVCLFCKRWESGGIESFLFNVISHMNLEFLELDIVASSIAESVFTDRLKELGVQFYQLSGSQQKLTQNWWMFQELHFLR